MSGQQQSKAELIDERKANLPLPDDPPVASDWQSADATKVNVGSGGVQSDVSYGRGDEAGLREPATDSTTGGVDSGVGRQQQQKSKAELIDERKANLPLPDDPPVASDWQSADATKVNVGSGGVQSDVSYGRGDEAGLRGPATDSTTGGIDSGVGRAGYDVAEDATK